jgi:hypothetical protein
MTRDLLGLGERGFHAALRLGLGHVLDVRRQRPLVAERILERARAVAVELVGDRPDLRGAGARARRNAASTSAT